ncbi:hypothetical protein ACQ86N_23100 [Puia sp. P3]|uniref:hypothetical protein n=1 Tax=Puia sp. P3 TaxID=3423952 RepID=UPI003D66F88F
MITETFAPVNFPIDGPEIGPMIIFKDVTPIYLKVNFQKWCEIALAEVGTSRQLERKVICHIQTEFIGLINAVYCTAAAMMTDGDDEALRKIANQYIKDYYKKDAKRNNIRIPTDYFQEFFKSITPKSTRSILWLLMEVVTANKDKYEYKVNHVQILNLFERFQAVVNIAHDWQEQLDKRDRSTKKPGLKDNKKKK